MHALKCAATGRNDDAGMSTAGTVIDDEDGAGFDEGAPLLPYLIGGRETRW
ncbi:MAG: hypothetical protein JXR39_08070 [Marinilabiliaceae bacterium]|nr:hypothetical protein [Marinilabiliaceae bacterium]